MKKNRRMKCFNAFCETTGSFVVEFEHKEFRCCGKHRDEMMNEHPEIKKYKDVRSPMCKECDEGKACDPNARALWNWPESEIPRFCDNCKQNGMVKTHFACAAKIEYGCLENGNKKYDGYCAKCFKHKFPTDERLKTFRTKEKEDMVHRTLLNNGYEEFIHDKAMYTEHCACVHRRRIDFRKQIDNTMLCIEVDEKEHSGYMTEEDRYNDIVFYNTMKYVFIRFNPDKYKVNGKSKNPPYNKRETELLNEINKQINRIDNGENTELVEIIKMYYTE